MFTLTSFYRSKKWVKLIEQLRMERVNADGQLLCEHCGKPIVKSYDCIGHHKTELTEENVNDYSVSLNPDNISLICFRCHNDIHQRFGGFCQRVYLVYGAPCAGKSTWVRSVAEQDDLIVDIDMLWEAICLSDRLHKPNRLKANVFGLRDCLLDQIRCRTGMWRRAYVIGGYPLESERERVCDMLRAEPVFIDATPAECLGRAPNEAWREYIRDWFDAFTA